MEICENIWKLLGNTAINSPNITWWMLMPTYGTRSSLSVANEKHYRQEL